MIGILGGTFDPVHHGHLRLAIEVLEALNLDSIRLIPLNQPNASKSPVASGAERWAMLQAAVAGESRLVPDDRELRRGGISYTVETLQSLREELPDRPLCLILGMDAFARIDRWHQWQRLLELSHIVIATRPGSPAMDDDREMAVELRNARVEQPGILRQRPAGSIYSQPIRPLDISSTAIREALRHGRSVRYLVPPAVLDYIHENHIYQEPA
jgi:nicotinate-nucleotide adenylyltransferase